MDPKLTKDEKKAIRQEEWQEKLEKEKKQQLYKTVAIWSFGGLLVILAIWALVAFSMGSSSSATPTLSAPKVTASDFQTGPINPNVTLIEYADFQCPACEAYYPIIKQLQQNFGSRMNFVYRFFPLKTIHQNAENSAKAAYAASLQGKFWQMHDKLFDTQNSWATLSEPENTFVGYAKDLELDTTQFKKDYEAASTLKFVENSFNSDTAMGLNGTPTFFVNGKEIDNPQSYNDFKALLDKAIK